LVKPAQTRDDVRDVRYLPQFLVLFLRDPEQGDFNASEIKAGQRGTLVAEQRAVGTQMDSHIWALGTGESDHVWQLFAQQRLASSRESQASNLLYVQMPQHHPKRAQ
jgi:hypothetical protein